MTGTGTFDLDGEFERALRRVTAVVGEDMAGEMRALADRAARAGDPARAMLPPALTWGWLLDRPGLSRRERALAVIAVDVARGARRALADHYALALAEGVTVPELRELLLQLGPFAGYPSTNESAAVLAEVLTARAAATPAAAGAAAEPEGPGWFGRRAELQRLTLVVPDARAAARLLHALLGVDTWSVTRLDETVLPLEVDGEAVRYGALRAVGTTSGGLPLELVQPTSRSPWSLRLLLRGAFADALQVATLEPADLDRLVARAGRAGVGAARTSRPAGGPRTVVLGTGDLLGGYAVAASTAPAADLDALLPVDDTWSGDPAPDGGPLLAGRRLDHVGGVVTDVAARTAAHARVFGAPRWPVNRFSSADGTLTGVRRDGSPAEDDYVSAVARVGGFAVELCQPLVAASHYRQGFLDPCGEGLQHLFFGPWSTDADWDRAVEVSAGLGHRVVSEGTGWDGAVRYGYLDTRPALGVDLEIARIDPDAQLDTRGRAAAVLEHDTAP